MNIRMPAKGWSAFGGKKGLVALASSAMLFAYASTAFAHATVKPAIAGVGAYQVFTVNVPNEKDIATTGVRLILPEGFTGVTPNVKPGWRIEIKTKSTGKMIQDHHGKDVEERIPTEIVWSGGQIPEHQRDEFPFQLKLPSEETTLIWKVYQSYADGSVVSWELEPGQEQPKKADGTSDFSKVGPASTSKIVNDLATPVATTTAEVVFGNKTGSDKIALVLSVVALVLAGWSVMKKS